MKTLFVDPKYYTIGDLIVLLIRNNEINDICDVNTGEVLFDNEGHVSVTYLKNTLTSL